MQPSPVAEWTPTACDLRSFAAAGDLVGARPSAGTTDGRFLNHVVERVSPEVSPQSVP